MAAIDWYHTLALAPGVLTPGWFDHRAILEEVPLAASLAGLRCLDVGTFNGFWAFEMERRDAREVVALDVLRPERWDWPVTSDPATIAAIGARQAGGAGFEIARRALASGVTRLDRSVYDLDRADVGGFDVVFLGSLLLHLRDPVDALERVRSVCDGRLVVMDAIDLPLTLTFPRRPVARLDGRGRPWWWQANAAALVRIVESAGFDVTAPPRRVYIPPGAGWKTRRMAPRLLLSRAGREHLTAAWRGDPHAVLVATPAASGGDRDR